MSLLLDPSPETIRHSLLPRPGSRRGLLLPWFKDSIFDHAYKLVKWFTSPGWHQKDLGVKVMSTRMVPEHAGPEPEHAGGFKYHLWPVNASGRSRKSRRTQEKKVLDGCIKQITKSHLHFCKPLTLPLDLQLDNFMLCWCNNNFQNTCGNFSVVLSELSSGVPMWFTETFTANVLFLATGLGWMNEVVVYFY